MNLLENLHFNHEKPTVFNLKNNDKQQIMVFGLKENQLLKRHTTPIPATLIVMKGAISFDMNGQINELRQFDTIEIPVEVPHEVKAHEESIFMVIKEK